MNLKVMYWTIIISCFFTMPAFCEIASFAISNGSVTRTSSFAPTVTINFIDGSSKNTHVSDKISLVSAKPDIITSKSLPNGLIITRSAGVADDIVTLTWKLGDLSTTSTVDVKGQIMGIEIANGRVTRKQKFQPMVTLMYTDGDFVTDTMENTGVELVSLSPKGSTALNKDFKIGQVFSRISNSPDALVLATWEFTDGVTVQGTSTVDVKGQIKSIFVGNGTLVRRSKIFIPNKVRYTYTDGTQRSLKSISPKFLISLEPKTILTAFSVDGKIFFSRNRYVHETRVTATWEFTDGVAVQGKSTIHVEAESKK